MGFHDLSEIALALSRFIEVAKDGIFLLAHSTKEAEVAARELEVAREANVAVRSSEEIVAAVAREHIARSNADSRAQFQQTINELVEVSVQIACGAILQLAKQVVSARRGAPSRWKPGRAIGRLELRDVLLQARNQSVHADEADFRPDVLRVFAALEADFGAGFHVEKGLKASRAREVVELLGWLDANAARNDISELLG